MHGAQAGYAPRARLLYYSPALILLIIAIADASRLADPDLWRQIRVGQQILASGHPATIDSYSYSVAGHPWLNHAWLGDVVIASFYNALGIFGLKLFKFLVTAAIVILMASAAAETGASRPVQLGLLLGLAVALGPFIQFRPQIFSYVMLSSLMLLLARNTYRGPARLWPVIPGLALWANLHGGFVVGVAVIGAYGTVRLLLDLWRGQPINRAGRIVAIACLAMLATSLTPYGSRGWYTVAVSITSPAARGAILEWEPLIVAMAQQWQEAHATIFFYLALFSSGSALALLVVAAPKVDDWPLVIVAAMLTAGAFLSMRNLPLALIAILPPLSHHIGQWRVRSYGLTVGAETRAPRLHQAALAALAIILLVQTGFFSNRLTTAIAYPEQAVAFMRRNSLRGRILNDVNWGGYLIWHEPRSKVFIDGRFETLYPLGLLVNYLRFYTGVPGWKQVLDGYPHDYVLIGTRTAVFPLMSRQKAWRLIYHDRDAALFARAGSSAANLPGVPLMSDSRDNRNFP